MLFRSVTGRGLTIDVDEGFHAQPLAARIAALDAKVGAEIGRLSSSRDLTAVPLLGIPGWYAGNEDESFYGNTGYFRPRPANRASDRR